MQHRELLIREYYGAADDGFWRWDKAGDAIGWSDGKLIAFNEEITHCLQQLAPNGLPRLGALLLLMAATRKNWAVDGSEAGLLTGMIQSAPDPTDKAEDEVVNLLRRGKSAPSRSPFTPAQKRMTLLERVLTGLHKVRALDSKLRASLEAKAAIAALVFGDTQPAVEAKDARFVADAIRPGLLNLISSTSDAVSSGYGPILLLRDLADLASGLDRVTPEAVRLRMETGLSELPAPVPMEEEEEQQLAPSESARAVIQELLDSPEHAGMAKLAKQLLASTTLPRKLSESQEHEMGGYSDIANRGTPDRLLLSELAQDGLTLAVRVAMNEAMYLHRETPPSIPRLRRELLIDSGVRAWGVQRVFAASVALALAANTPKGATFGAWRGTGENLSEVDLCTTQGLIGHLAALEPDPHLGDAIPGFAAHIEKSEDPVEAIVLMPADALADPAVKQSLRALVAARVYVATVDRQGEFQLSERGMRGEKVIRRAKLSLDQLMSDSSQVKDTQELDRLPAIFRVERFPLRLPAQLDNKSSWSIGNWGALSVSSDGRLLRWTEPKKGGEQLNDRMPKGKLWWASPDCIQGSTKFVFGSSQKLVFYDLDLPNRELRGTPIQCPVAMGVTFHNGVLFCLQPFGVTEINPITGMAGRQLTTPSSLTWVGGRYFVDGKRQAWMALSHDGHSATLDPLPHFGTLRDEVIHVWDAVGFSGPLALTIRGELLTSQADDYKLLQFMPRLAGFEVLSAIYDGTRLVLTNRNQMAHETLLLTLTPEINLRSWHSDEADERIAAIARPASLRKRFRSIGITKNGSLAMRATRSVVAFDRYRGGSTLRQHPRATPFAAERDFAEADLQVGFRYRLQVATWPSGDRAVLDSRGLLHLQPVDAELPEVTLVLAEGEMTGWCNNGTTFGKEYFLPDDKTPTRSASAQRKVYEDTIGRFVEAIRAND
ncbi:hypothetical protein NG895_22170 [Aeoliella sp. ICT_H6.2]|uniref:Uncharacterized protein n=1 Tax=Aeoliella straminimaris TaxID=2954799 RepID=A0A9X2FDI7_9BACT|nr:hypothetical protein [Aeoliella straminimaris]MCO6046614.1 hypothetical protein [Aeoliella straminimaris]